MYNVYVCVHCCMRTVMYTGAVMCMWPHESGGQRTTWASAVSFHLVWHWASFLLLTPLYTRAASVSCSEALALVSLPSLHMALQSPTHATAFGYFVCQTCFGVWNSGLHAYTANPLAHRIISSAPGASYLIAKNRKKPRLMCTSLRPAGTIQWVPGQPELQQSKILN